MKKCWRVLGAGFAAIMAGLIAGALVWNHLGEKLLPDLSEKPSVVSYYTARR